MIKKIGDIVLIQLSSSDSNIYLIGDTLIDSGTGLNFSRLKDVFRIMKKDMKSIKTIVNTHCHFDHIGGNGYFLNAKIAIHGHDSDILEKGDKELSMASYFEGNLRPRKPDTLLKDGDKIDAGDYVLKVVHTPGHTLGSICLLNEKKSLLFSGDTIFESAIGRVDFLNSDPALMQDSLQKLSGLDVKSIYPGHGNPFQKPAFDKTVKMKVKDFEQKLEEGEIDEDYV